jgi:PPK2 family polyphosphate:nucleotide phosphotransferase
VPRKDLLEITRKFTEPFRVTSGKGFRLDAFDPAETLGLTMKKDDAARLLERGVRWLAEEQSMLYAQDRWSLLLLFQAPDAAGKDGAIRHVMSGINPQGCQVFSFKQPSSEDLDHDFLWRYHKRLPERGRMGIFNRSYYEEVLVVRVHKTILAHQKLPSKLVTKQIWDERLADIAQFERYLARQGTILMKFFLNLSKDEQWKRLLGRLDDPNKNWKFSAGDIRERGHWDEYRVAYQRAIRATASKHAPWYVVPADNKWFTRLVVASAIIETVERLDLHYPKIDAAKKRDLDSARRALMREPGASRLSRAGPDRGPRPERSGGSRTWR